MEPSSPSGGTSPQDRPGDIYPIMEPSSPSSPSSPQDRPVAVVPPASPSPSTAATTTTASTAVKWADQVADTTSRAKDQVADGTTKMVGWTFDNAKLETSTSARGLRPMHVRVSVRVHHVSFLHPGLDNGGRATIGDRNSKRWSFGKKKGKVTTPPGLLQFGSKKGVWKNPMSPKNKPFSGLKDNDGGGKNNAANKLRKDLENEDVMDTSEISEIISAEAFRLSRDGIIQHHYALNHAGAPQQQQQTPESKSFHSYPGSTRMLYPGSTRGKPHHPGTAPQNQPTSSFLSPYSSSNPQEAARYYKECAERPKGYRRLVVSSAAPTSDVIVPPPPPTTTTNRLTASYRHAPELASSKKASRPKPPRRGSDGYDTQQQQLRSVSSTASWHFEKDPMADKKKEDGQSKDDKNENLFDNVEYQYIGPPQTGPDFFQLLRKHGAATFGRYLPELACSVPNHSIGFEVRKSKSKRRCASTQPLVAEAPHVIWGDARDKMLSRIAKEGCPLIDSRKFEYVSNVRLDETELSESLMVCGATLWVQNAPDEEGSVSSTATMKPNYTKGMVKAEYYGGKFVDGTKEGISVGVKGLTKGTKGTINAAVKGTKGMIKGTKVALDETKGLLEGGKKLLPIPHDRELASTATTQPPAGSTTTTRPPTGAPKEERRKRRDKLKSMFNPKKVGKKLRRRKRKSDVDGQSVDGSLASESEYSVGSESVAADSEHITDALKDSVVDDNFDHSDEAVKKTPEEELEEEFTVVKPVPYVLLLDDIIDIRIVSFPDKDDVIANFPISVASVMVQRSIEERTEDPLKPSELTATFIQEPSAHQLRWGVELKVTIRAVEVKPHIPRVVPRPKDVIDEEMNKIRNRLVLIGKKPDEIKKELQVEQDKNGKEENDLNGAIVHYGYGAGENEGAGQSEVRLRQMFYCEREHGAISRKMKRRALLTDDEKQMIHDAKIDPSSVKKGYTEKDAQKLLELLEDAFPGIEKRDDTGNEQASLKKEVASHAMQSSLALAMAQSLDNCLGGLSDMPTVPAIQKRMHHTVTEGIRPQISQAEAKEWCKKVAEQLSSHVNNANTTDATVRSSISTIQNIIAESALRSALGSGFYDEGVDGSKGEEMKLNEDEIALTRAESSESQPGDSLKLSDWVSAVASQLEACAEELDDGQESLAYSETLDSLMLADEGNASGLVISSTGSSSPGVDGDIGDSDNFRPRQVPPVESRDELLLASSPTYQRRASDPDEVLWDKILSQKEEKPFSDSGARIRSATSISTVKNALPRSYTTTRSQKIAKKSHSHRINTQASSLSATLVYLSLVVAVFVTGAALIYQSLIIFFWPVTQETN